VAHLTSNPLALSAISPRTCKQQKKMLIFAKSLDDGSCERAFGNRIIVDHN
jgi:hypothetical protein